MAYEQILYGVTDRIATITLNRPDRLNAWTSQMEGEVRQSMREASDDDDVRVIVLTGAGRGFCAGADMDNLDGISSGTRREVPKTEPFDAAIRPDFQTQYSYFPAVPKPIIAAINGPAAGLGLIMSLYCDIRIASDAAVFTTAFSRRGLIAEHGISWLLPRIVGHAHALDLTLSARRVEASEALRMGLVNQVLPAEEHMSGVMDYALDLAENVSPRSTRIMKRQIYEALMQDLAVAVRAANVEMFQSFSSDDFREGVAHYVEKRPAAFTGT
tara:strand:+ start:2177 stop:2989 length:813 start_codon:yes stop_codon:yes gene_type:complete